MPADIRPLKNFNWTYMKWKNGIMGIKSIRHNDWQSTSEDLADMGLFIENNKLVHAGR